jgi:hypothetical protein
MGHLRSEFVGASGTHIECLELAVHTPGDCPGERTRSARFGRLGGGAGCAGFRVSH